MFTKLLIANCDDDVRCAGVAAKAHIGEADVMPQPHRVASEASCDRAPTEPAHV